MITKELLEQEWVVNRLSQREVVQNSTILNALECLLEDF